VDVEDMKLHLDRQLRQPLGLFALFLLLRVHRAPSCRPYGGCVGTFIREMPAARGNNDVRQAGPFAKGYHQRLLRHEMVPVPWLMLPR
jgi:hypothetical protein